jgi:hypothetical protein
LAESTSLGSSLSITSFARFGSSLSVQSSTYTATATIPSVVDSVALSSSMSLRNYACLGHYTSVEGTIFAGFSISVAGDAEIDSSTSVRGDVIVGKWVPMYLLAPSQDLDPLAEVKLTRKCGKVLI